MPTVDEIQQLIEVLTPIIKSALEAQSLSVNDLPVADNMDYVNSLPALEEQGLNVRTVKVRLKDLLGKMDGDYAKELEAINKLLEKKVDGGFYRDGKIHLTSNGQSVASFAIGSGGGGGGGASSLGELTNVDEIVDQEADESRVLVQEAGTSLWSVKALSEIGGSGGGGGGVTMKVISITDTLVTTVQGANVTLGYNFTSTYQDDGTETGPGTATYTVNSQKVGMESVSQGNNYYDPTRHLITGSNTVRITVKDSTGISRTLTYTIEVIMMSISSSIDPTLVYDGEIVYRYTPVGAIEKTVHFVLDGKEIDTVRTSASNRQLTYVIPKQTHGAHLLKVYMTALVNEEEIRSNTLTHDLICIVAGNNTPIVASSFAQTAARQYDRLTIPFVVYTPNSSLSDVTLSANNVTVATQSVDRTLHEWNYRVAQSSNLSLKIASGAASKTFSLTVSPAEVIVEPEKANLQLWLTSQNRSNNDNNRNEWTYEDIAAVLTGFNFKTNGWISANDSTALRVSGDARVRIPLKIFKDDFRATGKTIEFEFSTRDVIDYEAVVIRCLNGGIGLQVSSQKAIFSSEQTSIDTDFKEEERVRVSFVVEKRTENRLIYIYINGIMSGTAQYPAEDNFQQKVPEDILIGSDDCTIDIYNIRVYDNDLNQYQMLDNFIGDIDDYDKALAIYNRNQVYNDYGDITYNKVLEQLPCLIFEGVLPTYKGDKKTNKLYYTDLQEPARSFSCEIVQNDVQGTSSQYYPRKNWKFKFKADITYTESGRISPSYALRANSIPVKTFCAKADFAESSGTHNTGMAKVINSLLVEMGLLTPPQKVNKEVRTTIDGFPIAIFHRETASDPLEFVGKYNFNNDKSTEETFGFTDGDESWEFRNNTSDRCLFKSADFSGTDWLNDFEARYPDDDAINAEYEAGTRKPEKLMALMSWVVSTKGNLDKFRNEVRNHFNLDNLIAYYLITELFGMVDQRAKNMFLTYFHQDGKWIFIFYDNDTCFGLNNEGLIAFGYNIEYHDKIGTLNVFNGESSLLWNNLEKCFPAEIEAMYKDIRTKGLLSYDLIMEVLNGEQSDKWCEAIYNADGRFKYIDPLIEDGNGSYLYAAQGSRVEHRKWWTYNRFLYVDSKYTAGSFLSDFATFRLYTPQTWAGVAPSANMTITPYADQYTRVKYGSYIVGQRTYKDVPVVITAPDIVFNDTETIIYGASRVKSLGDLSGLYAGTIDVSKATRLSELLIGSGVSGYHNDNLTVLSVGTNNMLRKLDIRNCPNLKQAVDLSGCENMDEILAQGTSITSVVLPPAGILTKLYLPASITSLTLRNQTKLTDAYFEIAGVEKLTTIYSENVDINIYGLIEKCLNLSKIVLNRVRMIDIDAYGDTLDVLYKLMNLRGIDELGNTIEVAVVTGKFHATTAYLDILSKVEMAYPNLSITYDILIKTPIRTIVILDRGTSIPLENAKVTINSHVYNTDEDGVVKVETSDPIDVSVSHEGYKPESFNYAASNTDRRYTIYLDKIISVTIIVSDQYSTPIKNASVEFNDITHKTGDEGSVTFKAYRGTYQYTVRYKDSEDVTGTIKVEHVDITTKVEYIRSIESLRPDPNGNIQILFKGKEVSLTISSSSADYSILWGDGEISKANGSGSITYNHIYTLDGVHNVEVSECGKISYVSFSRPNLLAFWTIGNSLAIPGSFRDCYNLEIVGSDIFDNGERIKSLSGQFQGCRSLKFIPPGLFDNCPNVTSFFYCFEFCVSLTSIPPGLFDNCPNVLDFTHVFAYCYKVKIIPSGLFDNCRLVLSFTQAFADCKALTFVPDGLFRNMLNVERFAGCFDGCQNLVYIPDNLFDSCLNVSSFSSCFYDCELLKHIVLPYFPKSTVSTWSRSYWRCVSLTYIKALQDIPQEISSDTFYDTGNCPIYVPDKSVEIYKTATNWTALESRIKPISQFIIDFPDNIL